MRASANGYQSTAPDGVGLHTKIPVVVRRVEFVITPQGSQVRVTATVGESEKYSEEVTFHLSYAEARAADIIERVE